MKNFEVTVNFSAHNQIIVYLMARDEASATVEARRRLTPGGWPVATATFAAKEITQERADKAANA